MRLGVNTGYWSSGPPAGVTEQIEAAERLGFDTMWTAEAYGSDALTPLAWWGSRTKNLRLGTAIMQMSARTPAAAAMAAITMDHLSGGRFILGLGASGPQVVEGWYGQPYDKPLARTREYVRIVREIIAREKPVSFDGTYYQMPARGGSGLGKPLKSTVHPLRPNIPIVLGAEGPKNVALAAEIADGWLPLFFSPKSDEFYRNAIAEGMKKRTAPLAGEEFEVFSLIPTIIGDDAEQCADMVRPMLALYMGGMGAKGANFHFDVFARMGWLSVCEQVQQKYLSGDKVGAMKAIPLELVEDVALVGPPDKVVAESEKWKRTCITEVLVSGPVPVLEKIAEVLG